MTVSSMTGYARANGSIHDLNWVWEMRSVNGKGLDARMRLPNGFEALEQRLKKRCGEYFTRGNIQISLVVSEDKRSSELVVNKVSSPEPIELLSVPAN